MASYYPQLTTGVLTQYPITKSILTRTIKSESPSGMETKLYDAGARRVEWELNYEGISRVEMEALAAFFDAMEGRLRNFTWVDPMGNLLAWNEDLTANVWVRDPMLEVSANITDPLGGSRATRVANVGQSEQRVEQTAGVSSVYVLSFSGWVRGESATSISFTARSTAAEKTAAYDVTTEWQWFDSSFRLAGAGETVTFGVTVAGGAVISLFGLQVTAQPYAGEYRCNAGLRAIWPDARFDQDQLAVEALTENSYRTVVRITAAYPG